MKYSIDTTQLKGHYAENVSLADYSSWRIGGLADRFYQPADQEDLIKFIGCLPTEEPIIWLGLGSNTLVRDKGLRGTIIVTQGLLKKLDQVNQETIRAEAGVACGQVARFCARKGLRGLEFYAGIPGTVGGSLRMNAGAYGGETWKYVQAVETLTRKGERKLRLPTEYQIKYRQVDSPEEEWFLAAHFKLAPGSKEEALEYIRDMLAKRNASQPINLPNGGSVFRNPPGHYAAKLIEICGLKGYRIGGACVSPKHANFIVNDQGATAKEVEALIDHIAEQVYQRHGIKLVREVHVIGEKE
ncbi:MAG: UDP-N-acetylenolpyruvoylglucosamine reductase [Gammaproteobacteria bacterium RIFCSPHIGHO2_12_FULL_35_23]|nr:MAG: UDP-N-acetylenolpyruvoylglucosamine reductase [Gammaproteobacteria bacterium RIFCSPHIGHO2_12_FULL_35_23]